MGIRRVFQVECDGCDLALIETEYDSQAGLESTLIGNGWIRRRIRKMTFWWCQGCVERGFSRRGYVAWLHEGVRDE